MENKVLNLSWACVDEESHVSLTIDSRVVCEKTEKPPTWR